MFVPGKPFQPNIIFASKVRAYLSEAPFRCSPLGYAPRLTHNPIVERLATDKHPSLLQTFVNY